MISLSECTFQLAANKADLMVLEEEVDVLTKQKSTRIQWEINKNTTILKDSHGLCKMVHFQNHGWSFLNLNENMFEQYLFQTWSYCYKQHMSCLHVLQSMYRNQWLSKKWRHNHKQMTLCCIWKVLCYCKRNFVIISL